MPTAKTSSSKKTKTYIIIESQWVKEIVVYKHTIIAQEGLSEEEIIDRMAAGSSEFNKHDMDRIGTDGEPEYGESAMALAAEDTEEAISDAQDVATDKLADNF